MLPNVYLLNNSFTKTLLSFKLRKTKIILQMNYHVSCQCIKRAYFYSDKSKQKLHFQAATPLNVEQEQIFVSGGISDQVTGSVYKLVCSSIICVVLGATPHKKIGQVPSNTTTELKFAPNLLNCL